MRTIGLFLKPLALSNNARKQKIVNRGIKRNALSRDHYCCFLGIFSIYLMWKSGEPPSWNPDIHRFANIGMIEGEGPGSGFWPFWLSLIMLICCVWIGFNWYRGVSPQSNLRTIFGWLWASHDDRWGCIIRFSGNDTYRRFYGAIVLL